MKTLTALALGLYLLHPQSTHASPGCLAYWMGDDAFFTFGGSVAVYNNGVFRYSVNVANFNPTAEYGINQGDAFTIVPPNCQKWTWGYSVLCVCNAQGNQTCGNQTPQTVSGMVSLLDSVQFICDCPYGQSTLGFTTVAGQRCKDGQP